MVVSCGMVSGHVMWISSLGWMPLSFSSIAPNSVDRSLDGFGFDGDAEFGQEPCAQSHSVGVRRGIVLPLNVRWS